MTCTGAAGCGTAAGSCSDTCGTNLLTVNRACSGCGANLANGTCGGGTGYTCNSTTHTLCQTISCGGTTYRCTNAGGSWAWRTATSCDDSNACTYSDVCSGSTCAGTAITCTTDYCTTRTCNGTSSCTQTPINRCGDGTCNCGETTGSCPGDCVTCVLNALETFDTSALPSSWYLYDADGYGNDWAWQSEGNWICNSDAAGTRWVDDYLVTGSYSKGGCNTVTLEYDYDFYEWNDDTDDAWVYISVDGGAWQQVVYYDTDSYGHATHNLTGFLGPTSYFSVAFRYRGNYDYWLIVDNVSIYGAL